jgi:hypothetical protein
MKINPFLLTFVFIVSTLSAETALDPNLEPLRPFLGTWRGEFKNSTAERPMVDVSQWERALNGKAVRILHSINQGVYGGESLLLWDKKQGKIVYSYFTTADFQTTGSMTVSGRKITAHEKVIGDAGGPAEVRATIELREDNTMVSKAEFLKNGTWEPGHEITYRRAPDAQVVFK